MSSGSTALVLDKLLAGCGLEVGGAAGRDPQVHDPRTYARVLRDGPLGAGEAYMDGWWDAADLAGCFEALSRGALDDQFASLLWREKLRLLRNRLFDRQTVKLSRRVAEQHYDVPIPFWQHMLGKTMQYSCAYYDRGARNLDEAQVAKMDLVCEKLQLDDGVTVLETGCGWGSLARHMASRGAVVTSFTLSREQYEYARRHYAHPNVTFVCSDYRRFEPEEKGKRYDRIASIGIIEHVGNKNFDNLFSLIRRFMKPAGWAVVHGMAKVDPTHSGNDPWISRYIFPGGEIPHLRKVIDSITRCGLNVEDVHNLAFSYPPTLRGWLANVEAHWHEMDLDRAVFDERVLRMWRYFLSMSIGVFESRHLQLYHYVVSHRHAPKGAIPGVVTRVR